MMQTGAIEKIRIKVEEVRWGEREKGRNLHQKVGAVLKVLCVP